MVVPEAALTPFATRLAELRTELGLPEGTEFKWNPPKDHPLYRRNDALARSRKEMLNAAIDLEIKSLVS